MDWLNYHHLLYFWTVVQEGTVAAAGRKLGLAQPTVSAQIKTLEEYLGEKLFRRAGRNLVLTDTGRLVYRYADEIFTLGGELMDTLKGRPTTGPVRFNVGIADVVPKLVAHRLIRMAMEAVEDVHVVCHEGKPPELLGRLAVHELDLVLVDRRMGPEVNVRAYNHLLGESGVTLFATRPLARKLARRFPQSLDGVPFLFPTPAAMVRRELDRWFEKIGVHPRPVAEFEDSALLKVFGESGAGVFAAPTAIEESVAAKYKVGVIGRTDEVKERFYAISAERRIRHPAVAAIAEAARVDFLASGEKKKRKRAKSH